MFFVKDKHRSCGLIAKIMLSQVYFIDCIYVYCLSFISICLRQMAIPIPVTYELLIWFHGICPTNMNITVMILSKHISFWYSIIADVEKMTGCDKKFELIFRCMKQGVDATIQVLQSDADSKRSNKYCSNLCLFSQ